MPFSPARIRKDLVLQLTFRSLATAMQHRYRRVRQKGLVGACQRQQWTDRLGSRRKAGWRQAFANFYPLCHYGRIKSFVAEPPGCSCELF